MLKKISILCACFISALFISTTSNSAPIDYLSWLVPATVSNCPQAVPTEDPGFCASFVSVAICHCSERLPSGMCQDMDKIYSRMIAMFGSVEKACEWQKDTSPEHCIDDWSCYFTGKDKKNKICSGTGKACKI